MKLFLFCLLTLSLAACSSCNKKPVAVAPNSKSVTVTKEGDKTITRTPNENGTVSVVISQPTPPDNIPKDIPNFSEGTDSTYSFDPEAAHITLASYTTKSQRDVADYYEHELASSGWSANMTTDKNKMITIKADKNGRQIEIDVLPYPSGSRILLKYNAAA